MAQQIQSQPPSALPVGSKKDREKEREREREKEKQKNLNSIIKKPNKPGDIWEDYK